MKEPLVSVITPCYNSEKYIERYLKCLLDQTYTNIQLILINDGSSDKTEEIVYAYKDKLEARGMVLTYKYQANMGLGGAINSGLKLVEGEFFTWCDSDNLLTREYFEEKIKYFLDNPTASIVRCDGYVVTDSNLEQPISRMADGNKDKYKKDLFYECLTCNNFHFGCTMLRTSAFDRINPVREIYPSREGQNWQIMLPMLYYYEAHYIDKPMFYFVIREDSISHIAVHKGLEAILRQNDECEKIETITIQQMNISEEKECLDIINKQYTYIRFWAADQFGNEKILFREYKKMLEHNWNDSKADKAYRRWKNVFWRVAHYIKKH